MDKKVLIIAQILMTLMMAFSMSGIMMLVALGPHEGFFREWMSQFIIAWPIAFLMTQVVSRIAFPLAGILRGKLFR
ncbi:DUF2798 domain-containing protein [Falsigemmobacter intermedius]|uniref:DUF2798 domain-containing protein n=1 Tax=Falsigemmobacter intermedius TaxID=1553448 RepID=UPI003F0B5628